MVSNELVSIICTLVQSVDFVQMFHSVIIFWLSLVSAALVLYLKSAALGCVIDNLNVIL